MTAETHNGNPTTAEIRPRQKRTIAKMDRGKNRQLPKRTT
jgi:hypothetical protein